MVGPQSFVQNEDIVYRCAHTSFTDYPQWSDAAIAVMHHTDYFVLAGLSESLAETYKSDYPDTVMM